MEQQSELSNIIIVSSQQELDAAYESLASGSGGKILLESGPSYQFTVRDAEDLRETAHLTIGSLDPDNPAEVSEVRLKGAENITFEDLSFAVDGADVSGSGNMIDMRDSQNITIRNSAISSDAEGAIGTATGYTEGAGGLFAKGCDGITVEGSTVSNTNHAFAFLDSTNVTVVDNDISAIQGDGIRIGGVSGMLIEGNNLHDLLGSTQDANHSDMIQIWGTNISHNNENITIRENILDTGNGARYQMIFGHNEDIAENGFLFENIVIEDNVLYGAHQHGISIEDTLNATVRYNTVIYNSDTYVNMADGSQVQAEMTGAIQIGGEGAVIEYNIAHNVDGGENNVVLSTSSPALADDYRNHFVNVESGGSGDLRDLMLRPDSELNGVAGSSLLWSSDSAETLTAVADVTVSQDDRSVVTLDASLSRGPAGYVDVQGATYLWTFDDGTTATGRVVTHDFGTAGEHGYTLTVTLPDGSTDEINRTIDIETPLVFLHDFEGPTVAEPAAADADSFVFAPAGDAEAVEASAGAGWLQIGGEDGFLIERSNDKLFNLSSFNLGLTMDRADGASGVFLHLPRTMTASVDEAGYVTFELTTDEGSFTLLSESAVFGDNEAHKLSFVFDGQAGTLTLMVDGVADALTEASGTTAEKKYWGLTIGNTWQDAVEASVQEVYLLAETCEPESLQEPQLPPTDDMAAPGVPVEIAGTLSFEADGIVAQDLDYKLDGDGAWSEAGVDITKGTLSLTRANDTFYDADSFGVSFDLSLNEGGSPGKILYLHQTLALTLTDAGQLVFELTTDAGVQTIGTVGVNLDDGAAHRVALEYDAKAGAMEIVVDGAVMATGSQTGQTAPVKYWGLTFGDPWSGDDAGVTIDNIAVAKDGQIAPLAPEAELATVRAPAGDTVVSLDFEDEVVADVSGNGTYVTMKGGEASLVAAADGSQFLELGGDLATVNVSRDEDDLFNQDSFLFSFGMRSDAPEGRTVFGIHKSMTLDVVGDDLVFKITTTEGQYSLSSSGDILSDADWHDVQIAYSDEVGQLRMVVDGEVIASTEASGATLERAYWGLTLGHEWGGGFDGAIDDFTYSTNIAADYFDVA